MQTAADSTRDGGLVTRRRLAIAGCLALVGVVAGLAIAWARYAPLVDGGSGGTSPGRRPAVIWILENSGHFPVRITAIDPIRAEGFVGPTVRLAPAGRDAMRESETGPFHAFTLHAGGWREIYMTATVACARWRPGASVVLTAARVHFTVLGLSKVRDVPLAEPLPFRIGDACKHSR